MYWTRCPARRGSPNGFQHCRKVVADDVVREAKHLVARRRKEDFSFGMVFPLGGVNLAIEFDSQPAIGAAEIEHKRPHRMLAAELQASQASIT